MSIGYNSGAAYNVPPQSGDTVVAGNPFDDPVPVQNVRQPSSQPSLGLSPAVRFTQSNSLPGSAPSPMSFPGVYVRGPASVNTFPSPVVFYGGSQAPISSHHNAAPIHLCRLCSKEIKDDDPAIQCSVPSQGCNYWFHRDCAGLTADAHKMLMKEPYAEWVCDNCYRSKKMELVKYN